MAKNQNKKSMFYGLTDLGMKRTGKQALGFYIVYFVAIVIIDTLVGATIGLTLASSSLSYQNVLSLTTNITILVGYTISIVYIIVLGLLILVHRKLYNDIVSVILFIIAIILTLTIGNVLSVAFIALLTMRKSSKKP